MRNPIPAILGGIIAVTAIVVAFGSFYTVDEGERALVTRNGVVQSVAGPGLHFKMPIIDAATYFSVRDQVAQYPGLQAYTRDQQTATVDNISVNYRIDPGQVREIYERYGSTENMVAQLIGRRVGQNLEQTFGQFNAELAVRDRGKLVADFAQAVTAVTGPILITSVQVENFSFPPEYEKNINERMAAEVEALKAEQTAKKTVTEANADAEARIAQATAQAEAVRMAGEAEASAIRAKGAALRDNPGLVSLIQAERWNGVLPSHMIPNSAVPFLNVE